MKSNKKSLGLLFFIIIISFIFNGCSARNQDLHKISPNYNELIKSNNNTLVLIDSCVKSDNLDQNSNNFSVYKSKKINEELSLIIKNTLEPEKFKINQILSPTMCGYFPKESKDMKIVIDEDSESIIGNLPYTIDDTISEEYRNALKRISQASYLNFFDNNKFNFKIPSTLKSDLDFIKSKTNQNKILVINNIASDVSGSKSIAQGVTVAVFTLGMFTAFEKSGLITYVSLIDIEKEEIIWKADVKFGAPYILKREFFEESYKPTILDKIVQKQ